MVHRFRDEWAMRHFLHPKLLRKAREVRVQLEDIMKFQKMELISAGTDFDVLRYGAVWFNAVASLTRIFGVQKSDHCRVFPPGSESQRYRRICEHPVWPTNASPPH